MNKLREYFIGDILKSTDDVFERARAIMLLRLCYMFTVIFLLPLITDIIVGYEKAFVIHLFAFFTLSLFPFIIKKQNNLDKSINESINLYSHSLWPYSTCFDSNHSPHIKQQKSDGRIYQQQNVEHIRLCCIYYYVGSSNNITLLAV